MDDIITLIEEYGQAQRNLAHEPTNEMFAEVEAAFKALSTAIEQAIAKATT